MTDRGVSTAPAARIADAVVDEFKAGLRGRVLRPGDEAYDEARRLWNGMFDRRPALIARCAGAADVVRAVSNWRSKGKRRGADRTDATGTPPDFWGRFGR